MSDISPIGPGHPGSVNPASLNGHSVREHSPGRNGAPSERLADRVELSDRARFLEQLRRTPDVRQDVVERAREMIEQDTYPSDEQLGTAIERLLDDLHD